MSQGEADGAVEGVSGFIGAALGSCFQHGGPCSSAC